jgi:hypothetical protein
MFPFITKKEDINTEQTGDINMYNPCSHTVQLLVHQNKQVQTKQKRNNIESNVNKRRIDRNDDDPQSMRHP